MVRMFALAVFGLVLALPSWAPTDGIQLGTWRLTAVTRMGSEEVTNWLLKLETKDGMTTATLVSASPALLSAKLVGFTLRDGQVRIEVAAPTPQIFEGRLSPDGKKIVGTLGTEKAIDAAYMVPTDMTMIEARNVKTTLDFPEIKRAVDLTNAAATLEAKARSTKDADERVDLVAEAAEAKKTANAEVPKFYRDTIEKYPHTFVAGQAALALIQKTVVKASADELRNWAQIASHSAGEFGPRWSTEINLQIVGGLQARKEPALAAVYAEAAEKTLDKAWAGDLQLKVLLMVHRALQDGGKISEMQPVEERLAAVEKGVDREYLATVPSFQGTPFAGRNGQSERVVLMELFTGAQCPPCVASDVAFDVLHKTYKPSELVLIQYHTHIPGPDPMTNPDTEARWKYYREASRDVTGVPTAVFAGKPQRSSGGAMAMAEKMYDAYRKVIDPLLEEPPGCKITVSAARQGDTIHIQTNVEGLQKAGKDMKLRLVLVEEAIRYAGSNGIRYHHQVVRSMPGGADGTAVKEPRLATQNDVDLSQLRGHLVSYLDGYAQNTRPFPQIYRPLSMKNLRVIAFVQNDSTHDILQAVEVDVR